MLIRIDKIDKSFRKLQVLKEVSIDFEVNQSVAIIGPNGSGKTTLIKALLGMVIPDNGLIKVMDFDITKNFDYRRHIGYMPQIGRYPENLTMGQLFRMIRDIRGGKAINVDEELVDEFGLPSLFNKKMRTLSGGTRQKVSAALAFLFDPEIMILDEPTAGLDPLTAEILKNKILKERKRNKLFLITSHIMSDLDELCTHVVYMLEGSILFYRSLAELKQETGEEKLGRVMSKLMRQTQSTGKGD